MINESTPYWLVNGRIKYGFLKTRDNRIKYLKWLEKKLKYKQPSDWYKVSRNDFKSNNGEGMLNTYYNCSFKLALKDLYPDYPFLEWLFVKTSNGLWDSHDVRNRFAKWIAEPERLNIQNENDWYSVNQSRLMELEIYNGFWTRCNNSIPDCLIDALPELDLKRWKFGNVPNQFWEKKENRINFYMSLKKRLKINKPKDLEKYVTETKIRSPLGYFVKGKGLRYYIKLEKGTGYYNHHNHNLKSICYEIFPNHNWEKVNFYDYPSGFIENIDLKIERHPGYWDEENNRLKFIINLKTILNIETEEDWYSVSANNIKNNTGGGLLRNHYRNDHIKLLIENVKDFELKPWRFSNKPVGYWNDESNIIKCIHGLYEYLEMKSLNDFYDVGIMFVEEYCFGRTFLKKFSRNMYKLCTFVYKDYKWDESKFKRELNILKNKDERLRYLEKTAKELDIKTNDDWYNQTTMSIRKTKFGSKLIKYYQLSLISMLNDLIPGEDFKPWFFERVSRSYWSSEDNRRKGLKWLLEEKLNIDLNQAHLVTQNDLEKFGLITLLSYSEGSLLKLFVSLFDHIDFDPKLFNRTGKGEKKLFNILKELFPKHTLNWGLFYQQLRFSRTNRPMQLDFYLPELDIAIEYQGEQHYHIAWGDENTLKEIQQRDKEKREACKINKIELIEIRDIYWDKTKQGLINLLEGTKLYEILLNETESYSN